MLARLVISGIVVKKYGIAVCPIRIMMSMMPPKVVETVKEILATVLAKSPEPPPETDRQDEKVNETEESKIK